jgi:hypothetical protein
MEKRKVYSLLGLFYLLGTMSSFASPLLSDKESEPIDKVSKRVYHEAKVERSVDIRLTNKYGKINVISWDKDSIKLTVDIAAVAKSKEEGEKILQRVQIQPVFDEKYFILTTEIIEKQGSGAISQIIDNLLDKSKELIDKKSIEINLTIILPENAKLNLNNKYGDINFERNFKGSLQLTLAYGNLHIGELPPFANLNLQSCKAYIGALKNGRIALKYGELNLRNADRLYLESHSSEVNIDEIKELDIDSRNDNFDLISAYSMTGKTSFSKISMQELRQKARLEMQAGSLKVRMLKSSFEWIDIQSKSTDIKITPEESLAYQLDISGNPSEVIRADNNNTSRPSNDGRNTNSNSFLGNMLNGTKNNSPLNSYSPQTNLNTTSPNNANNKSGKVIKIHANGGQVMVR